MEEDKSQPEKVPQLPVSEQEVQIEAPNLIDKFKIQKKKILIGLGAFFWNFSYYRNNFGCLLNRPKAS